MFWFERQVAMMEREPQDVELDFDGDLPLRGITVDGAEYSISPDPMCGGWRVWVNTKDDDGEYTDCVFRGSKNECKNYVYWELGVLD